MDVWGGVGGVRDGERITLPTTAALCTKLLQSRLTLCDPMDHSPPGSSVHGVLQARIPEWLAILSPGDLLSPGIVPTCPACGCLGCRQILYLLSRLGSPLTAITQKVNQGSAHKTCFPWVGWIVIFLIIFKANIYCVLIMCYVRCWDITLSYG